MAKSRGKNKTVSIKVDSDLFIRVIDPNLYYSIQNEFKNHGVTFVDLNDGHLIAGNVNVDTVGMIRHLPTPKVKRSLGFPVGNQSLPENEKTLVTDVEATLNIYEPPTNEEPIIFTVQVVDQKDLADWFNITAKIGAKYIVLGKRKKPIPTVLFHLVPLTLPDERDPDSSISTMLGQIQRYRAGSGYVTAISDTYLVPEEDDFDEDDVLL